MLKVLPEVCRELMLKNMETMKSPELSKSFSKDLTFYLLLTQACNGTCKFCYQPKEFRQPIHMSEKVVDDTVKFALSNFPEDQVKFCLFGGEPTVNWDLLKYILGTYPQMRFQITTNGLVIQESKEVRDFLRRHLYHLNISLSLESLINKLGPDDFIGRTREILDLLISSDAEIHMVLYDPKLQDWFLPLFKQLYDLGVPKIRTSIVRKHNFLGDRQSVIDTFKAIADYVYFQDVPGFGRSSFDFCFTSNLLMKMLGEPMKDLPPTMCGCSHAYVAIDHLGDIYPCDWFANFPEFKVGSIYSGFNDMVRVFYEANKWFETLYEDCRNCICTDDIRLCPKAMCLAENYQESGNPFKPTKLHCETNRMELEVSEYILKKAIDRDLIKVFRRGAQNLRKVSR